MPATDEKLDLSGPTATKLPSLNGLLRTLVERQGSDLHLKPKRAPLIRVNGCLVADTQHTEPLEVASVDSMLRQIVPERLHEKLETEMAVEFGYGIAGVSRFRASVFYQRGTLAGVFRRVAFVFPSLDEWGLPPVLEEFTKLPQGLVLITGPTGSGKSSTLAAMMRRISEQRSHHIVTIEDPIEFLIGDREASVSQREIGTDTPTFSIALRNALRQDPDVIMVGEMRDEETIRTVLTAAETGHLVYSTLHTNNAVQTVDRIVSSFPEGNHQIVRQQLAAVIEAVVSLQLVPRADGEGMVAAVEIMRNTPRVRKLIANGDFDSLLEDIESSVAFHRMQSMNQSLAALVIQQTITRETAIEASANPSDLELMLTKLGFGVAAGQENGMAECTSDFSNILELQEIRKLHDELQERYDRDVAARAREVSDLKDEITRLGDRSAETNRIEELESENRRLAEQITAIRAEYEGKVERLKTRLREVSTKAAEQAPVADRKGFFRR